jgi:fused signal recognition particle receptor
MVFWRKKEKEEDVARDDAPETDSVLPEQQSDATAGDDAAGGGGWLSRLTQGLSKSSSKIDLGLGEMFKLKLEAGSYDILEDILIESDLGPKTAASIVDRFRERRFDKNVTPDEVKAMLAQDIQAILEKAVYQLEVKRPEEGPRVLLVCGVNGAGKTTTIGKLAHQLHHRQNKKVVMAAADTFRAAAIEQLKVWAERTESAIVAREIGADSAAVAFEAYEKAFDHDADILMIDTAGRLQNKHNLMAELEKLIRVLRKKSEAIPHEVILVLDATTGQNAISQVEIFMQMVKITGLIVTKLDGSAKGGIVVALADQFGIPVYAIGVGEKIDDLQPFRPGAFARALVGLPA